MVNVYEECPIYKNELITLRQTNIGDADELLKCYSDEKAVPLFNSDNCHGDDFNYTTLERMKQAISFWDTSYTKKHFVRWTVIVNATNEIAGTIEMFHRLANDEFNHFGVLRIDLISSSETKEIIDAVLKITNENFYTAFDVKSILTKATPIAGERIAALKDNGYIASDKKLMIYGDYFVRDIN